MLEEGESTLDDPLNVGIYNFLDSTSNSNPRKMPSSQSTVVNDNHFF